MEWDRSECREKVCYCHDDTAEPFVCSQCGCKPMDIEAEMLEALKEYDRVLGKLSAKDHTDGVDDETANAISRAWFQAQRIIQKVEEKEA